MSCLGCSKENQLQMFKNDLLILSITIGLGKQFDKEELNIKILKCLDRSWQPKVTAISETKDLTTLTTVVLFGKLRAHELKMRRLKEMEFVEKKLRSLGLKTKAADIESSEESSDECSDTENLNLLRKRFQKFIKMKGKMKNQRSKTCKICFGQVQEGR